MDNPQQDSGMGGASPSASAFAATSSQAAELGASPDPTPVSPPFLGDRSSSPPPFTIGKPPDIVEPVIPPEPIPEEKFVPNRIILIAVAVLVVVLVVALWWFYRPKAERVEPGEVNEPPVIEGPSPTPVIPADVDVPVGVLSPTIAAVTSPTKTPERVTPTRVPPTPIPTVPEKPLPEAGSVSQTLFMMISGIGAILAGLIFLL